jgi:hypothetical protein
MIDAIDMFEVAEDPTAALFTVHTRACEVCNTSFQTCNPKRQALLTMPCRAGAAASDTRITCRVCGATATVALGHPALLCAGCLEDLDGSRDRVAAWLAKALERLDANKERWEAELSHSPALDRWPAIQGALIAVAEKRATQAALDATWTKRKAEGGALARLLEAYEAYARECDRIGEELGRLDAAQREINTAYLATEL